MSAYDYGEQTDFAWFVMEFMEGGFLAALMQKHGPLPLGQAPGVCRDVLKTFSLPSSP